MGNLPSLNIGGLEVETCVIQGGMGVGISGKNLASAVANEGGAGIIASVGLGDHENFKGTYAEANAAALRLEIMKTRKMTNGIFGVNIMKALTDYNSLVDVVVEENVPLLFTGAGFDENLPNKIKNSHTMAIPVISYSKIIPHILNKWGKEHPPAAIVIEGPKAGGHLGYGRKRLDKPGFIESCLEKEVRKAVEIVKELDIPIIAAGGIYTGADIYNALSWGASGVQMGTRFVVTNECDANIKFKEEYLRATKEDIILIDSPVGFPGRAINNDFLKKVISGKGDNFPCPYHCLESCRRKDAPYCIAEALKEARDGNFTRGFAFAGTNAYRCDKIIPVKELMNNLGDEYLAAKTAAEDGKK